MQRAVQAANSPWVAVGVVSLVACLAYSRTLWFGFVWDDHYQIVANPLVRSWRMIPNAFLHHLGYEATPLVRYYRPMFTTWCILLFSLFRFEALAWHAGNILLHVLSTGFVYWFARAIKQSHWVAALAALLFAIHPAHVEAVAWVSAIGDLMATLLVLASFLCFLEAKASGAFKWKLLSCALFFAALWSKESALAFAGIVFAHAWLEEPGHWARRARRALLLAAPLLSVTAVYLALRYWAVRHIAQVPEDHTLAETLLTIPSVLWNYLRILFWPVGLNPLYHLPYVTTPSFTNVVLPLATLALIVFAMRQWSKQTHDPAIPFLGLWMVFGLIPVLYLPVFNYGELYRDRYLYLPSVAFVVLISKAICSFSTTRRKTYAAAIFVLLLAASLTTATIMQEQPWSRDVTLFERGARLNPANEDAQLFFAKVLINHREYARAQDILENLVQRWPSAPVLHSNLAIVYGHQGMPERAGQELAETFSLDPDYASNPHNKLEVARGYESTNPGRALQLLGEIWQQYPDFYPVAVEMASLHDQAGNLAEAERWLRHALTVEPSYAGAHYELGLLLRKLGRPSEASQHMALAHAIDPTLPAN